jgi:hypothetical protein
LIEALVALSIVAAMTASISALIASAARGTRSIETRLTRLEIARSLMTAMPDRDQLVLGSSSGQMADHPWRIEVAPFTSNGFSQSNDVPWVPQTIVMTVQSPTGTTMQISTVRLQRRAGG